jgi:hypothetical protein
MKMRIEESDETIRRKVLKMKNFMRRRPNCGAECEGMCLHDLYRKKIKAYEHILKERSASEQDGV